MEYKLIDTVQGPALLGDDEIVFTNQFQVLLDYADEDPDFVHKLKVFTVEGFRKKANDFADSFTQNVLGNDLQNQLYPYISALNHITQFEYQFLPSVRGNNPHTH